MRALTEVEKQWIFATETLQKTPTQVEGYTSERELRKRKRTIQSMESLALRVKLCSAEDPNARGARGVMTVAAMLVHRFYMRRAYQDFPEELIAGTMLFLASKIEEEPLKLRFICNACLSKFENDTAGALAWNPEGDNGPPPSQAYRRWEKEILATEEIVLETVCFDMGIEQPWVVLRRSIRGLDHRRRQDDVSERWTINEAIVSELGWTLLNYADKTPLCVLHPAVILSFTAMILVISLIEKVPLSEATLQAVELGDGFGLDIQLDDQTGSASGADLAEVQRCLSEYLEYCRMDLIEPGLLTLIPEEPEASRKAPYIRRYHVSGTESVAPAPVVKVETVPAQVKDEIPTSRLKDEEASSPRKDEKPSELDNKPDATSAVLPGGNIKAEDQH